MPDNLHFMLMKCFHHSNKAIVKRNTALSLLPGQGKILECLIEEDGLSPKELGIRCVIDKSTITSLLGKMEKQGFIKRTDDPEDKRAVNIWLTEAGRVLGDKTIQNGQYPCTFVEDAKSMKKDLVKLIKKSSVDILYLGLGASALCFVTWNFAVNLIGLFLSEYKPERNRTKNGFTK